MNKFIFSFLTLSVIFLNSNHTLAKNQPSNYNCLTREVWTVEKKAWCQQLETVKNTTYNIPDFGLIKLENGSYEFKDSETGLNFYASLDTKFLTFDDLNNDGQKEALSLLWLKGETPATFAYLVVVSQNGNHLATEFVGDRIKPLNLSFNEGKIILNMITQGENEPFSDPTLEVINTYKFTNNQLQLISDIASDFNNDKQNYREIELSLFDEPLIGDTLEEIIWSVFAPPEEQTEVNIQETWETNFDDPNSPTVTITQLNLPDDSIAGIRHLFQFQPNLNGPKWQLVWAGIQYKCQENRGSQNWSPEECF